eukprot:2665716-Prymnesium_polylepis.2
MAPLSMTPLSMTPLSMAPAKYDTAKYGTAKHGTARHGTAKYDTAKSDSPLVDRVEAQLEQRRAVDSRLAELPPQNGTPRTQGARARQHADHALDQRVCARVFGSRPRSSDVLGWRITPSIDD